jgi:hypothetical protein
MTNPNALSRFWRGARHIDCLRSWPSAVGPNSRTSSPHYTAVVSLQALMSSLPDSGCVPLGRGRFLMAGCGPRNPAEERNAVDIGLVIFVLRSALLRTTWRIKKRRWRGWLPDHKQRASRVSLMGLTLYLMTTASLLPR